MLLGSTRSPLVLSSSCSFATDPKNQAEPGPSAQSCPKSLLRDLVLPAPSCTAQTHNHPLIVYSYYLTMGYLDRLSQLLLLVVREKLRGCGAIPGRVGDVPGAFGSPGKAPSSRGVCFLGCLEGSAQHTGPRPPCMPLGCDRHRTAPGAVPIISPPLRDPPIPNLIPFAALLSSARDKTRWSQTRRAESGDCAPRNLGTYGGVRTRMSKTGLFAGAGLMPGWEISLLRASSKPGRAGPRPLPSEREVSVPLRAGLAIPEKNRFSSFWFPPSKESAEVSDLSRRCVC